MNSRKLIWILWPSFIVAGVVEAVFFTLVDPGELVLFGNPVELGKTAVYSLGFFAFWAATAGSSALTCFFQKSAAEINQCPLEPDERPAGCPRREGHGCF